MEWKLCALGKCPDQNEDQRGRIEGAGADQITRGHDLIDIIASHDPSDEQNAKQQADAPGAGGDQGNACAVACTLIMVQITDQPEGKEDRKSVVSGKSGSVRVDLGG